MDRMVDSYEPFMFVGRAPAVLGDSCGVPKSLQLAALKEVDDALIFYIWMCIFL